MLFTGQAGSRQMEETAESQLAISGISHRRTIFRSAGMNPFMELMGLSQLIWFLLRFKPDLVHCASPKGVLYGGIAARLCGVRGLVLAVSGMGYAFTNDAGNASRGFVRGIYTSLASFAFHHSNVHVIVQNMDDYFSLLERKLANEEQLSLIPGSGVDLSLYANCDATHKEFIVLLPARMLRDKGVSEFVDTARLVKQVAPSWRFVLAGAADCDNPTAIPEADLQRWQVEGVVEWLGHVENMVPWFQKAAIVCLPSYREGLPKALLEAAAASCAVVTTDVTGCREAIAPGKSGDLVPARDSGILAETLLSLIIDKTKRIRYGNYGRQRACSLFSIESVVGRTIDIYKGLLKDD